MKYILTRFDFVCKPHSRCNQCIQAPSKKNDKIDAYSETNSKQFGTSKEQHEDLDM